NVAFTRIQLGDVLARQRKYAEAFAQMDKAIAVLDGTPNPSTAILVPGLVLRGRTRIERGDREKGRPDLERAVALTKERATTGMVTAEASLELARLLAKDARPDHARVRELAEAARGPYEWARDRGHLAEIDRLAGGN